jgi:hypothetical protein
MLPFALRTLLLASVAAWALCALPASAPAAPYMVSVMQDDNQLVYGDGGQRRNALDRMRELGVEAVRATMLWRAIAPDSTARRKPRFNAAKPGAYPSHHWDRYDDLVTEAAKRGLVVYLNPTGGGPRWAHAKAPMAKVQGTYKPSPKQFELFVRAAGRRYSGSYRDENNGRPVLPRVSWWGLWNEPNQPGWLTPQGESKPGVGMVAMAPHLYRELLVAGARGLLASGHEEDLVLIAELAPIGTGTKPQGVVPSLRPGLFLREMFCLNGRYRPFQGREAEARGCGNVDRLGVLERFPRLGFGHHPYTRKRAPTKPERAKDMLNIGNVPALPRALDKIAARTGLLPPEMPVFFTEFGYQTLPDPFRGISHELQAQYINEGDFIAWRHPRVFSTAQFQLYDVPPRAGFPPGTPGYWSTYQSGVFTALPEGRAKLAATAYKFPLVVRRRGGTARIWGQARFAPNGAMYPVYLQQRGPGSSQWTNAGDPVPVSHNQGYFKARRPTQPGTTWRAVWVEPDFERFEVSREAVAR